MFQRGQKIQARHLICVLVLGALVVLPFTFSSYVIKVFTFVFMFAVLAQSWNFIGGYTGYSSFGNVAFWGVGGYIAALCATKLGFSLALSILTAALGGILLSILIGLPLLRLKGHYFAIGTLITAELLREIISNTSFAGGPSGIVLPIFVGSQIIINRFFYFFFIILLVLVTFVSWLIRNSSIGTALLAIKSDEQTAESAGINLLKYKIIAFALSGCFSAIAGALYAYWLTFIDPNSMFQVDISLSIIVMSLLGGMGTVMGPVIGAFVLELTRELTWSQFLELHLGVLGLIIILVVLFIPEGIVALIADRSTKRFSLKQRLRRYNI